MDGGRAGLVSGFEDESELEKESEESSLLSTDMLTT